MANHDHPSSSTSGQHQPLVPTSAYNDDTHNGALEVSQPYASPTFSRPPTVVNGGIDASWFFNSLRRRWMLATFMGLLIAAGVGAGLYVLFPESDTALARFLVRAEQQSLLTSDLQSGAAARDFDIFRATQIALIKGSSVLNIALANPNMQQVKLLQDEENPSMWLQENLDVRFEGESELLRVSLTEGTDNPNELKTIVDAVCTAYLDKVVREDRLDRIKVKDALVVNHNKLKDEIRDKWDQYRQIANDLGIAEGQFDPSVRMLFEEFTGKLKEKNNLETQIRNVQLEFTRWKSQHENPDLKQQQIDYQVSLDPEIQMMEQEVMMLNAQLRDSQKRSNGRQNREMERIQKDIALTQQQIQAHRSQVQQQIEQQIANAPDIELAIYTEEFQRQLQFAAGRLQQVTAGRDIENADGEIVHEMGLDDLKKELESKAAGSTDLMVRQAELDQLNQIANDLARRIESWEIELGADARVKLVEAAYIMPGINKLQRYAITGIGSIGALALTCAGIGYLEFLGRRLNGPEQVDEGLGLRVVGTLPALNAKRMMNPKHPLVAQLTESIDSVRTALMHDSTSKPRQVVMVTSPAASEGRTTVASQLAASLARAGRRTLLIDGDLRRPALHSLFDVPLEDGLCEVLRAEAEVTDVVRPTHAEGLWLMTAGYCDADAVHAMATDQIQPVFEKLRADYDFVIIDGAPVLGLSDSLMMGQHCDGALLSVLRDHTSLPSIYKATELLRSVGVRLVGSVVNGVSAKADRRVTHLQVASPKAARRQLESQAEEVAVAADTPVDDFDFSDLPEGD